MFLSEGAEYWLQTFDTMNTIETIFRFVDHIEALLVAFHTRSSKTQSSWKKNAKDYYFEMLAYNSLFTKRVEILYDVFEKAGQLEIKEGSKINQRERRQT